MKLLFLIHQYLIQQFFLILDLVHHVYFFLLSSLHYQIYLLPHYIDPTSKYIIAGLFAGITQSFVDTPIENLKVKQITNNIYDYRKVRLFNGFGVTMLRNMGFAVVLNICIHTHNDHSDKRVDFIRAGLGAVLGLSLIHI